MKFGSIKAFFEWRKLWAPKDVLVKTKNGFQLAGIIATIGILLSGCQNQPQQREFICADGNSIRYHFDMNDPEILCGVLNYE